MMMFTVKLPDSVATKQSFLIQVECIEIPNDYIRCCGTFACGQDLILP